MNKEQFIVDALIFSHLMNSRGRSVKDGYLIKNIIAEAEGEYEEVVTYHITDKARKKFTAEYGGEFAPAEKEQAPANETEGFQTPKAAEVWMDLFDYFEVA